MKLDFFNEMTARIFISTVELVATKLGVPKSASSIFKPWGIRSYGFRSIFAAAFD